MSETLERPVSRLPAPIRALRPRQWVKNVLVVLAPLAAGWLFRPEVLRGVALAFIAFCLVSSAVYLLNDIRDVEEDRLHPKKRFRPIAAGELSVPVAAVMAIVLGLGGLTLGYLVDPALAITLVVYVVIQILYSTVLKHLPVIDLAVVSSGFLLRAIAGGVAIGVPLSQWFLLVAVVRLAVHGGRQALLRDGLGRRRSRHPQVPGPLLGVLPALRLDPGGGAGRHLLQPLGVREPRQPAARRTVDRDLDRPVHPRACSSTPWRWTPGRRASRKTSCCTTACCKDWE